MFLLEHQNSYEHFRIQSVLLPSSLAHCFLTLPPQAFVHLLLSFRLLVPQSTALQESCPWDSVVTWNTLREATLEQPGYLGGSCLVSVVKKVCSPGHGLSLCWIETDGQFPKTPPNITKPDTDYIDLLVIKHSFFILRLVGAVIVLLSSLCYSFCIFPSRYGEKSQK